MDNTFDKLYYHKGKLIAGIDEVGVSDIAGPLVAACVVLPMFDEKTEHNYDLFKVNDCKEVPEKYRSGIAEIIHNHAIGIGIGVVEPITIDALGRLSATKLAIVRSVRACRRPTSNNSIKPDFLMIDNIEKGFGSGDLGIPYEMFVQGDKKSLSVAAASIIAKVYRDNLMIELSKVYPGYGFESNKGYPCEPQFKGIDESGIIPGVHRTSFWPFVSNDRFPEKESGWASRRKRWKKVTEKVLIDGLQEENN